MLIAFDRQRRRRIPHSLRLVRRCTTDTRLLRGVQQKHAFTHFLTFSQLVRLLRLG